MNCICCGKPIKQLHPELDSTFQPNERMWKNALVERIVGNYGSKFDNKAFYIAICDDCLNQAIQEKRITNIPDSSEISDKTI